MLYLFLLSVCAFTIDFWGARRQTYQLATARIVRSTFLCNVWRMCAVSNPLPIVLIDSVNGLVHIHRSKEPFGILQLHKSINNAVSTYRYMMVDVHQSERCKPFFVHSISEGCFNSSENRKSTLGFGACHRKYRSNG